MARHRKSKSRKATRRRVKRRRFSTAFTALAYAVLRHPSTTIARVSMQDQIAEANRHGAITNGQTEVLLELMRKRVVK